jgi:hypothetical protein
MYHKIWIYTIRVARVRVSYLIRYECGYRIRYGAGVRYGKVKKIQDTGAAIYNICVIYKNNLLYYDKNFLKNLRWVYNFVNDYKKDKG